VERLVRGSSQGAGVYGDLGPQGSVQTVELGLLGLRAQTAGQLVLQCQPAQVVSWPVQAEGWSPSRGPRGLRMFRYGG